MVDRVGVWFLRAERLCFCTGNGKQEKTGVFHGVVGVGRKSRAREANNELNGCLLCFVGKM